MRIDGKYFQPIELIEHIEPFEPPKPPKPQKPPKPLQTFAYICQKNKTKCNKQNH